MNLCELWKGGGGYGLPEVGQVGGDLDISRRGLDNV